MPSNRCLLWRPITQKQEVISRLFLSLGLESTSEKGLRATCGFLTKVVRWRIPRKPSRIEKSASGMGLSVGCGQWNFRAAPHFVEAISGPDHIDPDKPKW
jgi:hypothetical protein